jgi:uncharacterized membrane protein YjjP (DUF1212 family)
MGILWCDVASTLAGNSFSVLASDGWMDCFILVLGGLLSSFLVDFQKALLGF